MFDFVAQAKYNAWKAKAGLVKEDAMKKYIEKVNSLF
jgi:acyl-CoA-binding protein